MEHELDDDVAFFYNLATGQVEQGRQRAAQHLMGPYATREAAAAALETARVRTEAWDAVDEAERDEWDDDE
ncbi:hypothetical protein ACTVCO_11880 [Sanguibacter sp. A247]|uniref:hypothetical protein n=1 Tax=unclassified Sanguibacter TaxID=2645534 RepID=UPI003FD7C291